MPLDYSSEDATTSTRNGIPNGALTVLIIAAIAIVSVVITLFCMLVNNRRTARLGRRNGQRAQPNPTSVLRLSAASALSSPVETPRPANFPPMYICPPFDPKLDAPPSYEEAVRAAISGAENVGGGAQNNNGTTPVTQLSVPNMATRITITEPSTDAAQIDVEMTHAHLPTTSSAV